MKFAAKRLAAFAMALVLSFAVSSVAFAEDSTGITVNGRGGIEVDPDTAIIDATISTFAEEAAEAQDENNKIAEDVKAAMISAGIEEDRIVSEYNYVSPSYEYDKDTYESRIAGYNAYASISFRTGDVDNAGKYLDTAVSAGATGARVSFALENSSLYYAAALKEAVKAANDSAKAIADACGIQLGNVKSVQESSSNYYTSEYEYDTVEAEEAVATSANGISETNIQYDKISVTARLTITYEISY